MSELLDNYFGLKPLLIYRCGSSIFGLSQNDSDKDYIVITEGSHLTNVLKTDDTDYFVFSKDGFKNALTFENELTYFLAWLDNILLAPENIVYADEEYKKEFLELIKIDWDKLFPKWLERNIEYFSVRLYTGQREKSLYHLYRLHSLVSHYIETGKFEYYFSEEDKKKAKAFRNDESDYNKYMDELISIFSYLRNILEEVQKWVL